MRLRNHFHVTAAITLALASLSALLVAAPAEVAFRAPQAYVVGSPLSVASADLNGDGETDFAVAGSAGVTIFFGTGSGHFVYGTLLANANEVAFIALADVNQDGNADIIATDYNDILSVYFGDGTGKFSPPATYQLDGIPTLQIISDFNGDGRPDVAVLEDTGGKAGITVFLGLSGGSLQKASLVNYSDEIQGIAAGDVNNDGNVDLVAADSDPILGGTVLFLGRGDGTFEPGQIIVPQDGDDAVALADLNGDNKLDLILGGGGVQVLTGNGDGTFNNPVSYASGLGVSALIMADLNADGILDIVATNAGGSDVFTLYGVAGGTFTTATIYPTPSSPRFPGVGYEKVNHHGIIFVPGVYSDQVEALVGLPKGGFPIPPTIAVKTQPAELLVGDWNGDGIDDIAASEGGSDYISIYLGKGRGHFAFPTKHATASAVSSFLSADFTGDGVTDLVSLSGSTITTLPGRGDGTFGLPILSDNGNGGGAVTSGDFNGDGALDLAITNYGSGEVSILNGNGWGQFASGASYSFNLPRGATSADLNHDGIPDLVVSYYSGVQILIGSGDGSFTFGNNYMWDPPFYQPQPYDTTVVDWNGDGIPDIMTIDFIEQNIDLLLGNGDGSFQPLIVIPTAFRVGSLLVADYNRDGILDIGFSSSDGDCFVVLLGNGKGGVTDPIYYTLPANPSAAAIGHFLTSARADVAVSTASGISFLLNVTR